MLVAEIELDVAARQGIGGCGVVFHMIGLHSQVLITKIHVPVGGEDVAVAALRPAGGEFGDPAFRREAHLRGLTARGGRSGKEWEEGKCQKRGENRESCDG